jgi:hypothetical protein
MSCDAKISKNISLQLNLSRNGKCSSSTHFLHFPKPDIPNCRTRTIGDLYYCCMSLCISFRTSVCPRSYELTASPLLSAEHPKMVTKTGSAIEMQQETSLSHTKMQQMRPRGTSDLSDRAVQILRWKSRFDISELNELNDNSERISNNLS